MINNGITISVSWNGEKDGLMHVIAVGEGDPERLKSALEFLQRRLTSNLETYMRTDAAVTTELNYETQKSETRGFMRFTVADRPGVLHRSPSHTREIFYESLKRG